MSDLEQWDEVRADNTISVEDIDAAMQAYADARTDYDEKKKISNEADAVAKEAKRRLLNILDEAGKTKWSVDGLGSVSKTVKYAVRVPKDLDNKKAMLQHFRDLGPETYLSMVGVNFQTLNGYFNQQRELDPEFTIPGIEAPVAEENISFRKMRK